MGGSVEARDNTVGFYEMQGVNPHGVKSPRLVPAGPCKDCYHWNAPKQVDLEAPIQKGKCTQESKHKQTCPGDSCESFSSREPVKLHESYREQDACVNCKHCFEDSSWSEPASWVCKYTAYGYCGHKTVDPEFICDRYERGERADV